MTDDAFHRFAELGAGHALPEVIEPNITSTPPAPSRVVVDGVELDPAARLRVLAKSAQAARLAARAHADRGHEIQNEILDRERRIARLRQTTGHHAALAEPEIRALTGEISTLKAARAEAETEAEEATVAWTAAAGLHRRSAEFCRERGLAVPADLLVVEG